MPGPVEDGRDVADHAGDHADAVVDRIAAGHLIRRLPPRIRHLLALRFEAELTQQQIAARLGVSQMQVSRLLAQALSWLRLAMLSDVPPPWPGAEHTEALRAWMYEEPGAVTVTVAGELDRDAATRLRVTLHAALDRTCGRRLVVDLSGAPLIDVGGAVVLRDVGIAAALRGVRIHLTGVPRWAAAVLGTVGMPSSVAFGPP